jgi:RHS repeat-associated protein
MRIKNGATDLVFFLYADQLGSTNVTSDPNGLMIGLSLYKPWGESRGGAGTTLTDYGFTGQRKMDDSVGLIFYGARFYDPTLGRWAQPDNILPIASQGVMAWDRYEFVNNNSVNNTDSTGHQVDCHEVGCVPLSYPDPDPDPNPPNPGNNDPDQLDHGKKAKQYYDELNANRGWWNNNTPGTFTVWQMLGLWILFESDGHRNEVLTLLINCAGDQIYMEALKNGLKSGPTNSPYCSGSVCENGIFNFIGGYQGSAIIDRFSGGSIKLPPNPGKIEDLPYATANNETGLFYPGGDEPYLQEATTIGFIIQINESVYRNASPDTSPYDWGNYADANRTFHVTSMTKRDVDLFRWPR